MSIHPGFGTAVYPTGPPTFANATQPARQRLDSAAAARAWRSSPDSTAVSPLTNRSKRLVTALEDAVRASAYAIL
jgi:hypothetical protein